MNKAHLLPFVLTATIATATAELSMPFFFGDHMVLQRQKPAAIWGTADPGAEVTVSFKDQTVKGTADGKGHWKVAFKPMEADATSQTITVSDGTSTKTIQDVLVGEVWFASGQSNMQFALTQSQSGKEAIDESVQPGVRFYMARLAPAAEPQGDNEGRWLVSAPAFSGRFSAVAYYFATQLHKELRVPVGIIQSSWGGKPVETFTRREALASIPEGKEALDAYDRAVTNFDAEKAKTQYEAAMKRYEKALADWKAKPKEQRGKAPQKPVARRNPEGVEGQPTTLWNGMIRPFAGYPIRGAIWYQGEANAKSPQSAAAYGKLFPLMIRDWRKQWGYDFRFLWVQLANFQAPIKEPGTNQPWAILQDQQRRCLALDKSGMAVINDIGTANNIHPPNKKDVGERLARWALADDYGKDVVKCGPLYRKHEIREGGIVIQFDHAGKGLKSRDGGPLQGFEIRGADGAWKWAEAKIDGNTVIVSASGVTEPVAARYAWAANPEGANLVNSEGLPASIFTTE